MCEGRLKGPSFFPIGQPPLEPSLPQTHALKVAFPLPNRVVLRAQEGEGFWRGKLLGEGWGEEGERSKEGRAKSGQYS